jgi:hypothetical protein
MDHATRTRALGIGAACLLAVFALLVMRAPWATAGAAADAAGTPAEAATCGGSQLESPAEAMDIAVAETMEETRRKQAEAEADPSGWVVLNNRGYNYGPPHPVRIDPDIFLQGDPAAAAH